ncbi:MAG: hypothetical protein AB7V25_01180 [Mangrovibacterium sp.]
MIDIKPCNIGPISKKLDKAFQKISGINPNIDLDEIFLKNFKINKTLLSSKMNDYLILFDEGIKVIIRIHELCKNSKVGLSYTVLTAKLVTLSIGIRQMLHSGFVDCTKNLQRPFIETIDVLYACLINKELNDRFANTQEKYDSNDFYWKNFSKDKLKKDHVKLFRKIRITEEYIDFLIGRRKNQRSFLSESIHVSFISSMANFLMATIDWKISDSYYGKITTAYPMLLMDLIEEIYIFSQIFVKAITEKACKDFETLDIDALTSHYLKKYESIYILYHKHLYEKAEAFPKLLHDMMDEMKKNNA